MAAPERALYTARVIHRGVIASLLLGVLLLPSLTGAQDPVAALGLIKPNPVQVAKEFRVGTPPRTCVGNWSLALA